MIIGIIILVLIFTAVGFRIRDSKLKRADYNNGKFIVNVINIFTKKNIKKLTEC